jgi:hypothetical protein
MSFTVVHTDAFDRVKMTKQTLERSRCNRRQRQGGGHDYAKRATTCTVDGRHAVPCAVAESGTTKTLAD